jgi:hypothetical protein
MAGSGARFARAGYTTIKPLIEVDGLPVIEHVVRMFPGERDFLFRPAPPGGDAAAGGLNGWRRAAIAAVGRTNWAVPGLLAPSTSGTTRSS